MPPEANEATARCKFVKIATAEGPRPDIVFLNTPITIEGPLNFIMVSPNAVSNLGVPLSPKNDIATKPTFVAISLNV